MDSLCHGQGNEYTANIDALERTAAWVRQVALLQSSSESNGSLSPRMDEDDQLGTPSLGNDQGFPSIYDAFKDQLDSIHKEVDIPSTVKEFKDRLEKYGISQRFAAKYIMEKTSQGNLSFLLDKGRHKRWQELSPRGRMPYIRMRSWLDNSTEQEYTLSMLQRSKEYKKTGPKDGGGRREKFTVFQLMVLCRFFEEDPNPNISTRNLLAEKLGAPVDRITIWFQNQRARGFPAKKMLNQTNFIKKYNLGMDSLSDNYQDNTPLPTGYHKHGFLPGGYHENSLQENLLGNRALRIGGNGTGSESGAFTPRLSQSIDDTSSKSGDQSSSPSYSLFPQSGQSLMPTMRKPFPLGMLDPVGLNSSPSALSETPAISQHKNMNNSPMMFLNSAKSCLRSTAAGSGGQISSYNRELLDRIVKREVTDEFSATNLNKQGTPFEEQEANQIAESLASWMNKKMEEPSNTDEPINFTTTK